MAHPIGTPSTSRQTPPPTFSEEFQRTRASTIESEAMVFINKLDAKGYDNETKRGISEYMIRHFEARIMAAPSVQIHAQPVDLSMSAYQKLLNALAHHFSCHPNEVLAHYGETVLSSLEDRALNNIALNIFNPEEAKIITVKNGLDIVDYNRTATDTSDQRYVFSELMQTMKGAGFLNKTISSFMGAIIPPQAGGWQAPFPQPAQMIPPQAGGWQAPFAQPAQIISPQGGIWTVPSVQVPGQYYVPVNPSLSAYQTLLQALAQHFNCSTDDVLAIHGTTILDSLEYRHLHQIARRVTNPEEAKIIALNNGLDINTIEGTATDTRNKSALFSVLIGKLQSRLHLQKSINSFMDAIINPR